jgi:uncharacterized membrane protein HdeD (DUF308 family)
MKEKDSIEIEIQHLQQQMLNYFQTHWKLFLAEGILFILLGICAVVIPQFFTVAIVVFLGWIILFGGAVQIARALLFSAMPGFGSWLFMGILQVVVGYWFIAQPTTGVMTLTMLMALFFGFEGVAKISLAFVMRPLANWGFILFSGITALAFALIVAISLSETSHWLLGLLLGINMIFLGSSLVKISLHHKEIH